MALEIGRSWKKEEILHVILVVAYGKLTIRKREEEYWIIKKLIGYGKISHKSYAFKVIENEKNDQAQN